MDASCAPHAGARAPENHTPAHFKPANQWSRQELDALFERRSIGGAEATARPPDAPASDAPPNPETGE
jgi:hypothetical protein